MQFCITAKKTDVTSAFTWDKDCSYFSHSCTSASLKPKSDNM